MIVKNEAHVIQRALDSAAPFVDYFCVVDTGSTDGTQEIVAARPRTTLVTHPWKNFGYNRQHALEWARGLGDYVLFLDADDVLEAGPEFRWQNLELDGYTLPIHYGDTRYTRCSLVKSTSPWRWDGVVHEYLTSDVPLKQGILREPIIKILGGGARSKDPETYKKDAAVLERAVHDDPDNARYVFYLAQSYKDAGRTEDAICMYRRRALMAGFVEENWYAMYQIGNLKQWLEQDPTGDYLKAFQYRSTRAESLYQLARYHRLKKQYALGYLYAKHAAQMRMPDDVLFVDESIYTWRAKEELAYCSYYVGQKAEGREILRVMLMQKLAPEDMLKHFETMVKEHYE